MGRVVISSLPFLIIGIAVTLLGIAINYDPQLSLPKKIIDLKNGKMTREEFLREPQIIIMANRDAFELIKKSAEVFTYPSNTVWIANISAAPGWVIRAFIKPSLKRTADRVSSQIIYDPDGDWVRSLQFTSQEDDFLMVFYADKYGIIKVMEKSVPAKQYKSKKNRRNLGEEIVLLWSEIE